jgi:hypothetical protein
MYLGRSVKPEPFDSRNISTRLVTVAILHGRPELRSHQRSADNEKNEKKCGRSRNGSVGNVHQAKAQNSDKTGPPGYE